MTTALLEFFPAWKHRQFEPIERGQNMRIVYDAARLSRCFTKWNDAEFGDTGAYVRFHPRGGIIRASVVERVRTNDNWSGPVLTHRTVPLVVSVPDDATQVELWFHSFSQTATRCDAWDSHFCENYWFNVGGPPPRKPSQPVMYRTGAQSRPDIVNVASVEIGKMNAFPKPAVGPPVGKDIQTTMNLLAWVSHTVNGANAWIDLHVFDGNDALIHSETRSLRYAGSESTAEFALADKIYQGSTATPGSVVSRMVARKVQLRLYYEINCQVFTDGILHQAALPTDDSI